MLIKDLTDRFRAVPAEVIPVDKARKLVADLRAKDAEIGRLQQVNSALEEQISTLQQAIDQARFRTQTLERGYETQLKVARERAQTAEKTAEEKDPRIRDLEISLKLLQRKYDDAQARLDMFGPEPVSIDELLAGSSGDRKKPAMAVEEEPAEHVESQVLGDMLDPSVMFVRKDK